MRALQQLNEILLRLGSWGTILFITIISIVIPYEVIGRYLFQNMSTWSGEVSTYSLAWASMLGGAVGLKKGYQVNMASIVESVPPAVAKGLSLVACLFTLIFFGTMFYLGLYQAIYNIKQFSPAMEISMSIPYAALPVGFFIMFFFTLEEFFKFVGVGRKD